jgi:restriction system protein
MEGAEALEAEADSRERDLRKIMENAHPTALEDPTMRFGLNRMREEIAQNRAWAKGMRISALEEHSPAPVPLPALVVQQVVTLSEKIPEGQLIEAVTVPWYAIVQEIMKDPAAMYKIPPRKWEEIIAGAYKEAQFDEVILTPRSGDLGRDVIAVKKGLGTVKLIDQVKAYRPGHLVTAEEVNALIGVLLGGSDGASKGFVTTTSDFAPNILKHPSISLQIPGRIELINGSKLQKRLIEIAQRKHLK